MFRATLAACLSLLSLTSPAALAAGTATQSFRAAADAVEDAFDKTSRDPESCAQNIGRPLDTIVDRIDDFRRKSASDSSQARAEPSRDGRTCQRVPARSRR